VTKEQRFFDALRDVFVGAKVDGESGFINLMAIKSRYYTEGVFPRLKEDIAAALQPFPEFREELFERLYDFFHRYFSESGSIYFRHTALHQSVYEKVYTDDRDVVLFWKTHMLYYVKTDRLFRSMEVEVEGRRFWFDASKLEHKKANEKREVVYAFRERRDDGVLVFDTAYSERGTKTRTEDALRAIKKAGSDVGEELLSRAFRVFEKQSEVDYFINKDARAFLEEQFDLWMYQYLFKGVTQWTDRRIRQLQALKDIAFKIIAFIAQFEDELVRIWNKPKFALNSRYVITLDRIVAQEGGWDVLRRLLAHSGIAAQVAEWTALGMAPEGVSADAVFVEDLTGLHLVERWEHLPVDTSYFKDLELDILGLFDHLDDALDGRLIKSENYQALRTLEQKLRGQVQCIYIDPPFNTGTDFAFLDQYQDATWLSVMEDRLRVAHGLLQDSGTLWLHLDWNADHRGRELLDRRFGRDAFVNEIVWRIGWVSGFKTQAQGCVRNHDTIYLYAKTAGAYYFDKPAARIPYRAFATESISHELAGIMRAWNVAPQSVASTKVTLRLGDGTVVKLGLDGHDGGYWMEDTWNCNEYEELHSNKIKRNAKEYTPNGSSVTQKPEQLLGRIVNLTSRVGDIVCDFFAGTGTSLATAHKLHRRWIGVEQGSQFETDVLYRMKHVLAGQSVREPVGISQALGWRGGGFFKYYSLEQYEDTLRKARYKDGDLFDEPAVGPYEAYVFLPDLKMLEALEIQAETDSVKVDLSRLYEGIDVPETLSNLTGKRIRRIGRDTVEFEDGTVVDLNNLGWRLVKPLIWW